MSHYLSSTATESSWIAHECDVRLQKFVTRERVLTRETCNPLHVMTLISDETSKSSHSWVIHELSVAVLGCLMSKSSHSEFVNHSWVWWLSKSSHSWVIQELSVAVPGCTIYLQICQKRLYSWIQVEWVSFSSHELLLSLILESRTSLLSLISESRTSAESHSRTSVESILESQTSVESHSQVTNICGVSFSSHELFMTRECDSVGSYSQVTNYKWTSHELSIWRIICLITNDHITAQHCMHFMLAHHQHAWSNSTPKRVTNLTNTWFTNSFLLWWAV